MVVWVLDNSLGSVRNKGGRAVKTGVSIYIAQYHIILCNKNSICYPNPPTPLKTFIVFFTWIFIYPPNKQTNKQTNEHITTTSSHHHHHHLNSTSSASIFIIKNLCSTPPPPPLQPLLHFHYIIIITSHHITSSSMEHELYYKKIFK